MWSFKKQRKREEKEVDLEYDNLNIWFPEEEKEKETESGPVVDTERDYLNRCFPLDILCPCLKFDMCQWCLERQTMRHESWEDFVKMREPEVRGALRDLLKLH